MTDKEKMFIQCLRKNFQGKKWLRDPHINNAYSAHFNPHIGRHVVSVCMGRMSSQSSFGAFSFVSEGEPCCMVVIRNDDGEIINEIKATRQDECFDELMTTYDAIRRETEQVDAILDLMIEDLSNGK